MSERARAERDGVLVRAQGLGKKYRIYGSPRARLVEWASLGRLCRHRDFWALRDVSFELAPGDKLGVLGMNGAGKSTLLGLVAGLLTPNEGAVEAHGDVAALLDLAAGFHKDFTGRENVLLAGQLRGLTRRQMLHYMGDIVEFAEIGEFIDQPVRTYSTGMVMRLAFSVATMVTPDVLIVDEVISVGDAFFQHKCMQRMKELTGGGTALLFVSHSTDQVRTVCNRGLVLDQGRPVYIGDSERAADVYLREIREREARRAAQKSRAPRPLPGGQSRRPQGFPPAHAFEYGPAERAEIVNVRVTDEDGAPRESFRIGEDVCLNIHVRVKADVERLGAAFLVRDRNGVDLLGTTSHHYGYTVERARPGQDLVFRFSFPNLLKAGHYACTAAINRLAPTRDLTAAITIHQFDNVAGYHSSGLPDLDVYHRVYAPVAVDVRSTAPQPASGDGA